MKNISDKNEYFIFILEKYAEIKKTSSKSVLNLWKEKGIINYINDMYEQYHSERIENAIEDIDNKIKDKLK